MAKITINDFARKAYPQYIAAGMTPAGACALMGNQYSESAGFLADRVEYLLLQRLREDRHPTTKEQYTADVDSGKISRAAFMSPRGHHYGYGLSQWTTDNRKSGLYDLAKERGVSIADEQMQIDYTLREMKYMFPKTFAVLKAATNVKAASDYVLEHYETPANWQTLSATRADYAKQYYDEFTKGSGNMGTLNDLLALAKEQVGYLEKKSNSNLDSKTGNAGSANFTKFARDLNAIGLMGCQGQAWCGVYQMWLDYKTVGKEKALSNLGPSFYHCFASRDWAIDNGKWMARRTGTPKPGYRVIFKQSHFGLVTKVSGGRVYTNEGNTSGVAYDRNGGMVYEKSYDLNDSKILGYIKIEYDEAPATSYKSIGTGFNGMTATIDGLAVREGPGTGYKQVGSLKKGNRLGVSQRSGHWFKYQDGWVSGKYLFGWVHEDNKWWYVNNGYKYTTNAWQKIDGVWYYFDKSGWMLSSKWQWWKGKCYYLTASGAMAKWAYIKYSDHYCWVNADGVWEPQWDTKTPNLTKYKLVK